MDIKTNILLQDGLEAILKLNQVWPARRKYVLEELIVAKTHYVDNLSPAAFAYQNLLKQTRKEIKILKKELKQLESLRQTS